MFVCTTIGPSDFRTFSLSVKVDTQQELDDLMDLIRDGLKCTYSGTSRKAIGDLILKELACRTKQ